jgi:hypothetical protein
MVEAVRARQLPNMADDMTLFTPVQLWAPLLTIGSVFALPGIAFAQTDYSAGKTPPQLFASDCSACHRSPQGLASGRDAGVLTAFLREHYTTHVEWAGVLANYLIGVGGAAPRQRAVQPASVPNTANPQPPRPPGSVQPAPEEAASAPDSEVKPPAVAARERGKPGEARGAKNKVVPVETERDSAKAETEALQKKVRAYATVGEEAQSPSARSEDAAGPALRPSSDAVQSGAPSVGQGARPQAGAPVGGAGAAPPEPNPTNAPATPSNERPRTPPG